MAKCKRCVKSGLFLRVSKNGLCEDCERKIEGSIGYHHLEDWWETVFSQDERIYIEDKLKDSGIALTRGKISSSSQSTVDFLSGLVTWFKTKSDTPIAKKIWKKLNEVAEAEPVQKPGYYGGRHCSSYAPEVEQLIREGKLREAESLLYCCVEATEAEDAVNKWGVAPWFYDKLAVISRKEKDLNKEYSILERFSKQRHGRGVKPPKLLERFQKVKALIS